MELGATPLDKPLLHRSGAVEGRRWPTDLNGWLLLYDRLPPQGAGIALALVGYAGLLGLVAGAMPMLAPFLLPLRVGTLCISALIQKVLVLRLFVNCNFVELESLHLSSAHGALLVAIQLTLAQAPGLAPASIATAVATCATAAILFAAVLQLGVYAHFVHHIVVYRAKVEPFWTPVMLCFATLPLDRTGQLPYWLRLSGLLFGWGTTALMWPLCVRRMLRMPSKAADPSIFMLMAPVAFCTIGVFTNGDADALPPPALVALALLNVFSVGVTCAACWQRRAALRASLSPLVPGWVALTFPLASNANVATRVWLAAAAGKLVCSHGHSCAGVALRTTHMTPRRRRRGRGKPG
tara:strand:- start:324 stop:1379 length:1056 start_codon:yes stop_codon:yes gene_type:complete